MDKFYSKMTISEIADYQIVEGRLRNFVNQYLPYYLAGHISKWPYTEFSLNNDRSIFFSIRSIDDSFVVSISECCGIARGGLRLCRELKTKILSDNVIFAVNEITNDFFDYRN